MDHGELNIPLAKRGDIDRQLDAYKATQAATAKRTAREQAQRTRELREQAKAVLAAMPAEQLARIASKGGVTVAQASKQLQSIAYFTPARIVALAA
jgi:hypothetical protein